MAAEECRDAASGRGGGGSGASDVRREFGRRLRAVRQGLGYSQEEMAHALGIRPARYSKYEIGRSQAPFEVLIRIALLAKVDLDYLIAGVSGRGKRGPLNDELGELLEALPVAAVIFDRQGRLVTYNVLYQQEFFADQPQLLKRGTPQEVILRSWAHRQGLSDAGVEDLVRRRMDTRRLGRSSTVLQVGPRRLRISETIDGERRLVLVTAVDEAPGEG